MVDSGLWPTDYRRKTVANSAWTRDQLALIVASVITLVWTVSFLSDVFTHYKQNPTITPLMLGVAAWLFRADAKKHRNGDSDQVGNGVTP